MSATGFPVHKVVEGRSDEFKAHFLGTYFSMPVRFTKLLEITPTPDTVPEVLDAIVEFSRNQLGRETVLCKDTPDFINNRLMAITGSYSVAYALENDYAVEEVDAITGTLIGRPDLTPPFQLIDTVGVELMALLNAGLYPTIPDDSYREVLRGKKSTALFSKIMIEGWIGKKKTFYKEETGTGRSELSVLNLKTFQYEPFKEVHFESVEAVSKIEDLGHRLKALLSYEDRAAVYVRNTLYFNLAYAAYVAPKITYSVADVDAATRLGALYEAGPFEIWDMLGVAETAAKMEAGGLEVADWVKQMLGDGQTTFYQNGSHYNFSTKTYRPEAVDENIIRVNDLRRAGKEVARNDFARLLDMGDGVALLEFHNNPTSFLFSNTIDADTVAMVNTALERLQTDFDALVVGNDGRNFSSGANIATVVRGIERGTLDEVGIIILSIADAGLKLRHAPKPVVTAPHQVSVGAGMVLAMAGWAAVAAVETNLGLAEAKLGVIAAAGGCKEMLRVQVNPAMRTGDADVLSAVREAFQQLATSKISNTAWEAKSLGYLRGTDTIMVNDNYLLAEAKRQALQLVASGAQPPEFEKIYVAGPDVFAALNEDIQRMVQEGKINAYEGKVIRKTAHVLCGGNIRTPAWVEPSYIFDLECEAFLSLLGEEKTRERLTNFVQTGRLLRN